MTTRHKSFDVWLRGRKVDTVFYSPGDNVTAEEVRQALINHDGYSVAIEVTRGPEPKGSYSDLFSCRLLPKGFTPCQ